ncbi:MAG: hypothetical protein V1886_00340 [archaeon]
MPETAQLALQSASKALQTADHMVYITFPLIRENRLLIKILSEIYSAMLSLVNLMLQYEASYKRIAMTENAQENFRLFREKCSPRFGISPSELEVIIDVFKLMEEHKASPMEFTRQDKLVIMSDNLKTETVTLDRLKGYLLASKNILQKVTTRVCAKG